MDSDDDYYVNSINIDSSSSARKNKNKHSTSISHKTTREPKKPVNIPEKITGGEPTVRNLLLNLTSYFFSQYKQKNSNENEIVFIKGQPTQKVEKDTYKLLNPDFEGKVMYINLEGQPHRNENDGPAIIYPNGSNIYCFYGRKCRNEQNGPAETSNNPDGSNIQKYYEYDVLSRSEGPAVIHSNGSYQYYINGELHNENGPASHMLIEGTSNKFEDEYWLHGKKLSTLQFRILNFRNKIFKNTTENVNFNKNKL